MPTKPIPHAHRTIKEFTRLVKAFSTTKELPKKATAEALAAGVVVLEKIHAEPIQDIALLRRPIRYSLLPLPTTDTTPLADNTLYYKLTVENQQTWVVITAPPATEEIRIAIAARSNETLTDKEIEYLLPDALEKMKVKRPSVASLSYDDLANDLQDCPTVIWSDGDLFYANPWLKTIEHILPQPNNALFFELRALFHAQFNRDVTPILSELLQKLYPNASFLKSKEERFNATVWSILTLAEHAWHARQLPDSLENSNTTERITALATQFMNESTDVLTKDAPLFADFPTLSLSLHYFLLKRRFETLEHTLRAKNPTFHLAFSDLKHRVLAKFNNSPKGLFSFTHCSELINHISTLWEKTQNKTLIPSDIELFKKNTKSFQEHHGIKIAIMTLIGILTGVIVGFFVGHVPGAIIGAGAGGVLGSAVGVGITFFSAPQDPLQRMSNTAQKELAHELSCNP